MNDKDKAIEEAEEDFKSDPEPDPKRPGVVATSGIDHDYEGGGAPKDIDPETGQHKSYWVLSPDERLKGFVRPVRRSYMHVGIRPQNPTRPLNDEESERYHTYGYVAFEEYPDPEGSSPGRFWTQAQLDSGCRVVTTMSDNIAQSYARDPKFYGSTFCSGCKVHARVGEKGEFVWLDTLGNATEERVGT